MKDFQNETVIYGKPTCPYCVRARQLLIDRNINYYEIIVNGTTVTKETMNRDLGTTGLDTVPQIVLRGKFLPGGYTGLAKYFAEGGQ